MHSTEVWLTHCDSSTRIGEAGGHYRDPKVSPFLQWLVISTENLRNCNLRIKQTFSDLPVSSHTITGTGPFLLFVSSLDTDEQVDGRMCGFVVGGVTKQINE